VSSPQKRKEHCHSWGRWGKGVGTSAVTEKKEKFPKRGTSEREGGSRDNLGANPHRRGSLKTAPSRGGGNLQRGQHFVRWKEEMSPGGRTVGLKRVGKNILKGWVFGKRNGLQNQKSCTSQGWKGKSNAGFHGKVLNDLDKQKTGGRQGGGTVDDK